MKICLKLVHQAKFWQLKKDLHKNFESWKVNKNYNVNLKKKRNLLSKFLEFCVYFNHFMVFFSNLGNLSGFVSQGQVLSLRVWFFGFCLIPQLAFGFWVPDFITKLKLKKVAQKNIFFSVMEFFACTHKQYYSLSSKPFPPSPSL